MYRNCAPPSNEIRLSKAAGDWRAKGGVAVSIILKPLFGLALVAMPLLAAPPESVKGEALLPSILRIAPTATATGSAGTLYLDADYPNFGTTGFLGLCTDSAKPWLIMKSSASDGSGGFGVFNSNGTQLFRVASNGATTLSGNLLIGSGTVGEALQVAGAIKATGTTSTVYASSTSLDYLASGGRIVVFGPNTTTDLATFSIVLKNSGATAGGVQLFIDKDGNLGVGNTAPTAKLDVSGALHTSGDINVDGNINAKYQDVAEWVPASEILVPGTVVVLNPSRTNEVMSSSTAYDTTVAGVVSAQPGVLLGLSGANKATIATTGRVRVRVDARKQPIHVGDLLVTSDEPGRAMRSEPMDVGGRKFHQPGTIIGKALEPIENGEGEILVLLALS